MEAPIHIYRLLKQKLDTALEFYRGGDLSSGRMNVDKARALAAHIHRHQLTIKKNHGSQWALEFDPNSDISPEAVGLLRSIGQTWNVLASWLDAIIASLGRDQLLVSDEGIDLLLDRALPTYWDFNHDIIVITGPNRERFVDAAIKRGQKQILLVSERDAIEEPVTYKLIPETNDTFTAILKVGPSNRLGAAHFSALKKTELPNFAHLPTGLNDDPFEGFDSLVAQTRAQYVLEATQRKRIVNHVEQFLENLPTIYDLKSISQVSDFFFGKHVMLASAGPSLLDTLDDLSRHRDKFVLISLLHPLPTLLDHGITPDFVIMTDAMDHTVTGINLLGDDPRIYEIPFILTEYAHSSVFTKRFKSYFLIPNSHLVGNPISTAIHGPSPALVVGGSVSVNTVSLLTQFKVKSITLVGQDLSVPSSGPTYVSETVRPQPHLANRNFLTCRGINGEDLPTLPDYAHFIKEFETLAAQHKSEMELYNSTNSGAYLENWQHVALGASHPVVKDRSERENPKENTSLFYGRSFNFQQRKVNVLRGIAEELSCMEAVVQLGDSAVSEIEAFLSGDISSIGSLDPIERDLLIVMRTNGSLISYYTLPHKLETDASLESVSSLEENLMVSLYYYGALVASARRLILLLNQAMSGIEARMQ